MSGGPGMDLRALAEAAKQNPLAANHAYPSGFVVISGDGRQVPVELATFMCVDQMLAVINEILAIIKGVPIPDAGPPPTI